MGMLIRPALVGKSTVKKYDGQGGNEESRLELSLLAMTKETLYESSHKLEEDNNSKAPSYTEYRLSAERAPESAVSIAKP